LEGGEPVWAPYAPGTLRGLSVANMNDGISDLLSLAELTGGLKLHEHRCLIYDTQEQQLAAALPYLRAGLERRERCLYMTDENTAATILDALRKGGTDVDRSLQMGALIVTDKQETYLSQGRFDPDWMIGFLTQATAEATAAKFSGLRTILGEMTWVLGTGISTDTLIEYESKLNRFVREHDARVVCQYNRNRFSPELILGVIRTHPILVYGGIICNNPYYVPPDELLKPNQASREVERLLNNILKWEQSLGQLRALAARLQTVREDERTRAARDIHDELGYALAAIKLEFAALLRDLPTVEGLVGQRSQSILKLVDEAIQSIQRIATELRPGILDDLGFVDAVEWVAEDFQARTGTEVQIILPEVDLAIDRERATALFRILQEALTNVAQHAHATQVRIRLADEDGVLTLEIHDNGQGITAEEISANKSLGILGMRERSLLLDGEFIVSGDPTFGTTVKVKIPTAFRNYPGDEK
jgi:signal transduction histidine kinase